MANLFCENCGANLINQEGFDEAASEHVCKACGYVTLPKTPVIPVPEPITEAVLNAEDKKAPATSEPDSKDLHKEDNAKKASNCEKETPKPKKVADDDDWKENDSEKKSLIHEAFLPPTTIERERKERIKSFIIFWVGFLIYTVVAGLLAVKYWETHTILCTVLAVIFVLLLFGKYLYDEIKKNRSAGFASQDAIGRDVDEVIEKLEDKGFISIDTLELNDLDANEKDKEDTVVSITIKDESTFTAAKKFSYRSKILITYHSMKKTHPPVAASDITNWKYDELVDKFTEAGFVNVKTIPGNDLIKGWINKPDMVYKVSIDEVEKFSLESVFPIDARVEITFHSMKNKE